MSNSLQPHALYSPWNSLGQKSGVGSLSLPQGILPTQGSNPGLPHCRWILYQLSHKGSPWILEWVAYPFSHGSSRSRNWTRVSCTAGRFFTSWAISEALTAKSFMHQKQPENNSPKSFTGNDVGSIWITYHGNVIYKEDGYIQAFKHHKKFTS